jgi:hypothetical protein
VEQGHTNDEESLSAPCPALGFVVDLEPAAGVSADRLSRLCAEWAAFLDERGLRLHELPARAKLSFEVESEASQATQNDRAATEGWLATRPELAHWRVGDIRDLRADS